MTMAMPSVPSASLAMRHAADNAYYRRAVETPEYLDALALREKALHVRAELGPPLQVPLPPSADCVEVWLDAVTEVDADERVRAAKYEALSSLIIKQESLIQSVTVETDRILAALAKDLDAMMADVTEVVQRLDGAHTPAQVIAADLGRVWNELKPLRDSYDAIRQAQDWALAGDHRVAQYGSQYLDDDLASDTRLSNLDDVFPHWKTPAQNNAIRRWDTPRAQPWPPDPLEALVWLVTSGAKPWVPTFADLQQLKQQRQRDRAHPNGEPQPQAAGPQVLNQAPRRMPDLASIRTGVSTNE